MSQLCDQSGTTLKWLLFSGQVSAVEIVNSCIERIEAMNPFLNAFVETRFDEALADADQIDRDLSRGRQLGPLAGLPIAIKDLNDVKGLRTTFGSPLFSDNLALEDDDVVASVRSAGAIILGKTNVPEHGFGATTTSPLFGAARNPFNPDLSAGASTGGGAVALAARMAPFAPGSDFAGSLRTPAAFCGITGIRPSNGVVGTTRRSIAWSSFDVEGPMARTAADCKLLLQAMARQDLEDPLSAVPDRTLFTPPDYVNLAGLCLAVSEDIGFAPVSEDYRRLFRRKLSAFQDVFAEVKTATPDLTDAESTFMTLRGVGFVADFGPMEQEFGERLGPVVLDELARARNLKAAEIGRAAKNHTRIFRAAADFFRKFDLLITPAAAVPPFPHEEVYPAEIDGEDMGGYLRWEAIAWGITLTQCPAVVIPCGVNDHGLPFGIQLVGPHLRDGWLLDVAHSLQTLFQQHKDLEAPIADLSALKTTTPSL